MTILGFTKTESRWVFGVVIVIFILIFFNLQIAERRSRDFQRKDDIGYIQKIVDSFQDKYGKIPDSSDGSIIACDPKPIAGGGFSFSKCPWGEISATGDRIPVDPQNSAGIKYYYVSNGKRFQIFASLESNTEDEYNRKVANRKIYCGRRICNIGRASEKMPVDITIEEYEQKLP